MIKKSKPNQKSIHLALQGGGAHGAFTWGVLDYLLEDGRLKIEAISGTSAGALNVAALANGYAMGDIDAARKNLYDLWHGMSVYGAFSPYNYSGVNPFAALWSQSLSIFFPIFGYASPYQNNPYNIHFLNRLVDEVIDFQALKKLRKKIRLFISATNVCNNRLRIFTNEELTPQVLLATSCLPRIHQAVEIDGEYYWDGGYMGNPVLEPLVTDPGASDILVVQVNPIHINRLPTTTLEIIERIEAVSFNSSLSREIRMMALIRSMVDDGSMEVKLGKRKNMHLLEAEAQMANYNSVTKYDCSWEFLTRLFSLGRYTAANWLEQHYESIGKKSSINLEDWEPVYDPQYQNMPKFQTSTKPIKHSMRT